MKCEKCGKEIRMMDAQNGLCRECTEKKAAEEAEKAKQSGGSGISGMSGGMLAFLIIGLLVAALVAGITISRDRKANQRIDAGTEIIKEYQTALPYYASVGIQTDKDGKAYISVSVGGEDITHFGDVIYSALAKAEEMFDTYYADIAMQNIELSFKGTLKNGTLINGRSGYDRKTEIKSAEELAEIFPALKITLEAEENGVSAEERAMYNEVMDALNADLSRPEREILEEIAPDYGMTAEELEAWMYAMMDKLY